MKRTNVKPGQFLFLILILLIIPFFLSCFDDDDETQITVCNYDDNEYNVELRRDADDVVVDDFHLDEWYDIGDQCDTFEDVHKGRYYLAVLDGGSVVDESDDFYMDKGDHKSFHIDNDGDISDRSIYDDGAIVSVCNSDDDGYRVTLKRSLDNSVVADVDIERSSDVSDQCNDVEDLDEDSYYVEIYKVGADAGATRSEDFYLESGEIKYVTISQSGDLVSD